MSIKRIGYIGHIGIGLALSKHLIDTLHKEPVLLVGQPYHAINHTGYDHLDGITPPKYTIDIEKEKLDLSTLGFNDSFIESKKKGHMNQSKSKFIPKTNKQS